MAASVNALQIQLSKARQRRFHLATISEPTAEQTAERLKIEASMDGLEESFRAALQAQDERRVSDPGESAEIRTLERRDLLSEHLMAASHSKPLAPGGAAAEYNQALHYSEGAFPLRLLAEPVADQHYTATSVDSRANQSPRWLDRIFPMGDSARWLGVTYDSVGPGVASYVSTTTGMAAQHLEKGAAASATDWVLQVLEQRPTRHVTRCQWNREDAFRIPTLEASLRRDMSMSLADSLDLVAVKGADAGGTSADLTGLATLADVTTANLTQANKVKAKNVLTAYTQLIEGEAAQSTSQLRILSSVGQFRLLASTIANASAENQTILQFLEASGLMMRVRGGIETNTAAGDLAAVVGLQRSMPGAAVMAIWEQGELIRDPYTEAKSGQTALTLTTTFSFAVVRKQNFARVVYTA